MSKVRGRRHRSRLRRVAALFYGLLSVFSGAVLINLVALTCLRAQSSNNPQASPEYSPPKVEVLKWQPPSRGWLYVLDPQEESGQGDSQVLLVDPDAGAVRGVIRSGYRADIALSPDGTRLYVLSGAPSWLTILDTQLGKVVRTVEIPDRATSALLPWTQSLALTTDGRRLFLSKLGPGSASTARYSVGVFDTVSSALLPDDIPTLGCGYTRLMSISQQELAVHCLESNDVRRFRVAQTGQPTYVQTIPLPRGPQYDASGERVPYFLPTAAAIALLPETPKLTVVMGDSSVYVMDTSSSAFSSSPVGGKADRWVPFRAWPESPDRKTLYLGRGLLSDRLDNRPWADQIAAIDTISGQERSAAAIMPHPFWTLTISTDGRFLYAPSPTHRLTTVIDASTLQAVRDITNVGLTPALALVSP